MMMHSLPFGSYERLKEKEKKKRNEKNVERRAGSIGRGKRKYREVRQLRRGSFWLVKEIAGEEKKKRREGTIFSLLEEQEKKGRKDKSITIIIKSFHHHKIHHHHLSFFPRSNVATRV